MERKHIDITGSNKTLNWVKAVPAKNFKFINANGVTIAAIARNYWLDTKKDKIRYQSTGRAYCSNASYNHIYNIYCEVYPGIFAYAGTATDSPNSMAQRIERILDAFTNTDQETIENFRQSLKRYN